MKKLIGIVRAPWRLILLVVSSDPLTAKTPAPITYETVANHKKHQGCSGHVN